MTPQTKKWMRRVAKPWRLVFVVYALALTLATHWPSLELGTEAQPAPDKILHMLAFGGFALLLWRTRWLGAAWMVCFVALAWAALDEVTQALPILQRTFSWLDIFASGLGVLLAVVWIWALGPIGGPANRARLAFGAYVLGDQFVRLRTWIVALAAAGIGAVVMAVVMWMLLRWAFGFPYYSVLATLIVAGVLGAVAATHLTLAAMYRRQAFALKGMQPCFECGGSCCDVAFDEFGRGRCPSCHARIHRGQWREPMDLPLTAALRGAPSAALTAIGLFFVAVFIYGIVLGLSDRLTVAGQLLHLWQRLTPDMQVALDLAGIALILGVAVRLYRFRQAQLHDRQHVQCRCCNHDLRGTPLERGLGRCGECGTPFVRFPHQPEAVSRRETSS